MPRLMKGTLVGALLFVLSGCLMLVSKDIAIIPFLVWIQQLSHDQLDSLVSAYELALFALGLACFLSFIATAFIEKRRRLKRSTWKSAVITEIHRRHGINIRELPVIKSGDLDDLLNMEYDFSPDYSPQEGAKKVETVLHKKFNIDFQQLSMKVKREHRPSAA